MEKVWGKTNFVGQRTQITAVGVGICALVTGLTAFNAPYAQSAPAAVTATEKAALSPVLKLFKVVRSASGKESLVPASSIRPGDTVEYRVTYRNTSTRTLTKVNAVLPIPAALSYVPNSARPGNAQASLDGRTYGAMPLKRRVRDENGVEKTVLVPFSQYRFLRWSLGNMSAGRTLQVSARARLAPSATASVVASDARKGGGR